MPLRHDHRLRSTSAPHSPTHRPLHWLSAAARSDPMGETRMRISHTLDP